MDGYGHVVLLPSLGPRMVTALRDDELVDDAPGITKR